MFEKYKERNIEILEVRCDPEFDKPKLRNSFPNVIFETCAKGEHVPMIERSNRTIKERLRSVCHSIPYAIIPILMCKELV